MRIAHALYFVKAKVVIIEIPPVHEGWILECKTSVFSGQWSLRTLKAWIFAELVNFYCNPDRYEWRGDAALCG